MTTLTNAQVAAVAIKAGFTGTNAILATAICNAESGRRTDATNHNSNNSTDYGLWQINSVHSDLLKSHSWSDPMQNAQMAFAIYKSSGWRAWTTYNTGAYLPFMVQAQQGVAQANGGNVTVPEGSASIENVSAVSAAKDTLRLTAILTDKNFYIRLGMFMAGGSTIVMGIIFIGSTNPTVKKIAKSGAKVAKDVGIAAVLA